MNIAIQFDRKYLNYVVVMLKSLCVNNHEHIDIYVLNKELTKDDFEVISDNLKEHDFEIFDLKIDQDKFDGRLPKSKKWPIEIYFKLLIPELLPEYADRVLFLDADVIVNGSLKDLYYADFNGKALLAAQDANATESLNMINDKQYEMLSKSYGSDYKYFNSGVILFNLEYLRKKCSFDIYRTAMEKWDYEMCAPDQDLLNYVHGNNVGYIDWNKYNLSARVAAHKQNLHYDNVKENSIIVHFTGSKPWNSGIVMHYDTEQLWWDYAKLTEVYEQLAFDFIKSTVINPEFETVINNTFDENNRLRDLLSKSQALLSRLTS